MSNQKKKIILNEIAFWKKSKMLPEKYCDYLTMIYTEGNVDHEQLHGNANEAIKAKERNSFKKSMLLIIFIALLSATALFVIPSVLITSIIVGVIALSFMISSFIYTKSRAALAVVLQVSAAIILLALTVRVVTTYFENNNIALYVGLCTNCLFWLLSGLKMKLSYFTFSGILGLVVLGCYWLYQL